MKSSPECTSIFGGRPPFINIGLDRVLLAFDRAFFFIGFFRLILRNRSDRFSQTGIENFLPASMFLIPRLTGLLFLDFLVNICESLVHSLIGDFLILR